MKTEMYLSLNEKALQETSKEAKQRSQENEDEEHLQYPNLEFVGTDAEFKDGFIDVHSDFKDNDSGKELGYLSICFRLEIDEVIDVIEFYMKKLGKLKTVLEATK